MQDLTTISRQNQEILDSNKPRIAQMATLRPALVTSQAAPNGLCTAC